MIKKLFDFIKGSPTAYHATKSVADRLLMEGYTELFESDEWKLKNGGKYFVRKNGSSLIAFRFSESAGGFMISASHSDSPAFRVKVTPESVGAYKRIEVEKYGGMIYYSWLDRPLSVAGRVFLRTAEGLESRLVDMDADILTIPSVAIHMNRTVNDGYKFNPATDLLPLFSGRKEMGVFISRIADKLGVSCEDIVSHDLFVYNRDEGKTVGADGEFILCPRLDDLECVFAATEGFLTAENSESVPVLAIFDNEEVGSQTKQGAASTFLFDVLSRVGGERYGRMLSSSFMVSADNAHAIHPAHPELSDPDNAPILNGGVVIKYNASQRYATDGLSAGVFELICKRAGVKTQTYYNRADMPGGSTLGSIADTVVSVPTVDIGLAQLAMHSANETAGSEDLETMVRAFRAFYSAAVDVKGDSITIR